MKKRAFLLMSMLLSLFVWSACSDDEKSIRYSSLPETAQSFVETYFPNRTVVYAEREKDDGRTEYKVLLSDATELKFNEGGVWESIDCPYGVLPDGILLPAIEVDMAGNYPDAVAYKVERELGGFDVSLNNGIDLIYSSDGTFIREDRTR